MNNIKNILNYFFSFILSIILVLIVGLLILKSTIFNKKYVNKVMLNNNYYENVSNNIRNNMENYMVSSGLPEKVLDDIYTKDDVINDVNLFIDNIYNGKETIVDTSILEEKLDNNIDSYLDNHDLKITSQKTLDMFKKDIGEIYAEEVNLYDLVNGFISPFYKINNIVNKMFLITIIAFLVILLVNTLLFKSRLIGSIISASGLMLLVVKIFILNKIDIQNVLIISKDFSNIIKDVYLHISNNMLLCGIILFISGIVINIFVSNSNNKVLKNK